MENRYLDDTGEDCLVSVDGVDFEICEPWPYERGYSDIWYSDKFKGPGLRYMICLSLKRGDIVRIGGPSPCGKYNDGQMFEKYLINELEPHERVEADRGYQSFDPEYAKTPRNEFLRSDFARELSNTARARQETVNGRMKQWECLNQVYWHKVLNTQMCYKQLHLLHSYLLMMGRHYFS